MHQTVPHQLTHPVSAHALESTEVKCRSTAATLTARLRLDVPQVQAQVEHMRAVGISPTGIEHMTAHFGPGQRMFGNRVEVVPMLGKTD